MDELEFFLLRTGIEGLQKANSAWESEYAQPQKEKKNLFPGLAKETTAGTAPKIYKSLIEKPVNANTILSSSNSLTVGDYQSFWSRAWELEWVEEISDAVEKELKAMNEYAYKKVRNMENITFEYSSLDPDVYSQLLVVTGAAINYHADHSKVRIEIVLPRNKVAAVGKGEVHFIDIGNGKGVALNRGRDDKAFIDNKYVVKTGITSSEVPFVAFENGIIAFYDCKSETMKDGVEELTSGSQKCYVHKGQVLRAHPRTPKYIKITNDKWFYESVDRLGSADGQYKVVAESDDKTQWLVSYEGRSVGVFKADCEVVKLPKFITIIDCFDYYSGRNYPLGFTNLIHEVVSIDGDGDYHVKFGEKEYWIEASDTIEAKVPKFKLGDKVTLKESLFTLSFYGKVYEVTGFEPSTITRGYNVRTKEGNLFYEGNLVLADQPFTPCKIRNKQTGEVRDTVGENEFFWYLKDGLAATKVSWELFKEPKFKVGDVVKLKNTVLDYRFSDKVLTVTKVQENTTVQVKYFGFYKEFSQDDLELYSKKEEEEFKVGDIVKYNSTGKISTVTRICSEGCHLTTSDYNSHKSGFTRLNKFRVGDQVRAPYTPNDSLRGNKWEVVRVFVEGEYVCLELRLGSYCVVCRQDNLAGL